MTDSLIFSRRTIFSLELRSRSYRLDLLSLQYAFQKQICQKHPRGRVSLTSRPIEECVFRRHDFQVRVRVSQWSSSVVIGVMPRLLQIDKHCPDISELRCNRNARPHRQDTSYDCRARILLAHLPHLTVIKRPAHAGTQRWIGNDPSHRLVNEQMEQGVVGGRHAAAQIHFDDRRWRRNRKGLGRDWRYESPSQGQQVIVERHWFRPSCIPWRCVV